MVIFHSHVKLPEGHIETTNQIMSFLNFPHGDTPRAPNFHCEQLPRIELCKFPRLRMAPASTSGEVKGSYDHIR